MKRRSMLATMFRCSIVPPNVILPISAFRLSYACMRVIIGLFQARKNIAILVLTVLSSHHIVSNVLACETFHKLVKLNTKNK